jgi:hypothetical protein
MLKKTPFKTYTLDEDKDSSEKVFTVRLNTQEQAILKKFMDEIGQTQPSTALKIAFFLGSNVLQAFFLGSENNLKVRLFKKNYNKFDKNKPKEEEM